MEFATLSTKVSSELALLESLPKTLSADLYESSLDAWRNPSRTATLVLSSAALATALTLVGRNQKLAGKLLEPVVRFGIENSGKLGASMLAFDLMERVGQPVVNTWNNPDSLEAAKVDLSKSLSRSIVDYTLMGVGGGIGVKYGPNSILELVEIARSSPANPQFAYSGASNWTVIKPQCSTKSSDSADSLMLFQKRWNSEPKPQEPITLSGDVQWSQTKPNLKPAIGDTPDTGDVRLFWQQSKWGNTYVGAKIFNGKQWRSFDVWDIAKELSNNSKSISALLESHRGETVLWEAQLYNNSIKYRLKSRVDAEQGLPRGYSQAYTMDDLQEAKVRLDDARHAQSIGTDRRNNPNFGLAAVRWASDHLKTVTRYLTETGELPLKSKE